MQNVQEQLLCTDFYTQDYAVEQENAIIIHSKLAVPVAEFNTLLTADSINTFYSVVCSTLSTV